MEDLQNTAGTHCSCGFLKSFEQHVAVICALGFLDTDCVLFSLPLIKEAASCR